MLERTMVYVDTSYLLASFYNSWETGARSQLEIDLPEVVAVLGKMIKDQLAQPIHRQYWYDGIPDSGPHRYQRALRSCDGVQLRTGQLIEWGERRTQKGVDTRLVADMVVASCSKQVSDMVLVSGDADMIPGVQEASDSGIRVHLYGFGWDSMSSALRHSCDTTTILDPREDFSDAMQLQVLEGPLPPSIRERPISDAGPEEEVGMAPVPGGSPLKPREDDTSNEAVNEESDTAPAEPPFKPSPPKPKPAGHTPKTPTSQDSEQPGAQVQTTHPEDPHADEEPTEAEAEIASQRPTPTPGPTERSSAPKPSMMAPRRKLRSRYVPLPEEVWSSAGFQTPFDVGQQYATWWFEHAATGDQRDSAHQLSGGGLPPEIDRPLLQFACETLHEYTLSEHQRVNLRDGFHSGIRGVLINFNREF